MKPKPSNLKRQRIIMLDFVKRALDGNGPMGAYHARPDYQQNDNLAWITLQTP